MLVKGFYQGSVLARRVYLGGKIIWESIVPIKLYALMESVSNSNATVNLWTFMQAAAQIESTSNSEAIAELRSFFTNYASSESTSYVNAIALLYNMSSIFGGIESESFAESVPALLTVDVMNGAAELDSNAAALTELLKAIQTRATAESGVSVEGLGLVLRAIQSLSDVESASSSDSLGRVFYSKIVSGFTESDNLASAVLDSAKVTAQIGATESATIADALGRLFKTIQAQVETKTATESYTEIFPETEVTFTYNESDGFSSVFLEPAPFILTSGARYSVSSSGETYQCRAEILDTEEENITYIVMGDIQMLTSGSWTGTCPFVIVYITDGTNDATMVALNVTTDVTIPIQISKVSDHTVLPETEITLTLEDGTPVVTYYHSESIPLIPGQAYNVTAEDTTYNCIAKTATVEGDTSLYVYIGDDGIFTNSDMSFNGDYPFVIVGTMVEGALAMLASTSDATLPVRIYHKTGDVLPETEIPLTVSGTYAQYIWETVPFVLVEGETYVVESNGESVECVAKTIADNGYNIVYIGDAGLIDSAPTGEYPFVIACAVYPMGMFAANTTSEMTLKCEIKMDLGSDGSGALINTEANAAVQILAYILANGGIELYSEISSTAEVHNTAEVKGDIESYSNSNLIVRALSSIIGSGRTQSAVYDDGTVCICLSKLGIGKAESASVSNAAYNCLLFVGYKGSGETDSAANSLISFWYLPILDGDTLIIRQVHNATLEDNILEVV